MYETTDITGWTAGELVKWLAVHPDWADADIRSCECETCGDVTELARRVR
jgi:hypothetical protein